MKAIKVRELNKYIKKYVAMDYFMSNVDVEGEISNLTKHSNGNYYFTLKDDNSTIKSMIYYTDVETLEHDIHEGDSVIATGAISVFERDASITFFIRKIKANGSGNALEAFERLKESLGKEGLFDREKKKLKAFPQKIGVVTSKTGAAIQDIINVLHRRNPAVDIILYPSLVQGEGAAENILEGLRYFETSDVDAVILGRGGGAYEDLIAFNDEKIARYIFNMSKPVISAVGHEIDYVISDYVADFRAPTPSSAAEIVAFSKDEIRQHLDLLINTIKTYTSEKIRTDARNLEIEKNVFYESFNNKLNGERLNLSFQKRVLDSTLPKLDIHLNRLNSQLNLLNSKAESIKDLNKLELQKTVKIMASLNLIDKTQELAVVRDSLFKIQLNDKICTEKNKIDNIKNSLDFMTKGIYVYRINELKNLLFFNKLNSIKNRITLNYNIANKSIDQILLKTEGTISKKEKMLLQQGYKLKSIRFSDIYAKDESGKIITSIKQVSENSLIDIFFKDGYIKSKVVGKEEKIYE